MLNESMTMLYHFIGSKNELPPVPFHSKASVVQIKDLSQLKIRGMQTKKEKRNKYKETPQQSLIVYETEEDAAAGISISKMEGFDGIKSKLRHPSIYELGSSGTRETLEYLFQYIHEHSLQTGPIELYTCYDHHEMLPKIDSLDVVIDFKERSYTNYLGTFRLNKNGFIRIWERFTFKNRQYVLITGGD
ncbi:hypothetical protein ACQCVE_15775 [Metabacillus sp. 113a]|uniref:hypothetical protein n=1 Tax=Metabacillus sp. 113a TaxID=3404706 RepID=UPI003CF3CCB9